MKEEVTFTDEKDGSVSVFRYGTKIMSIVEISKGDVKTKIFNSFESIRLSSINETKKFILDMYKGY